VPELKRLRRESAGSGRPVRSNSDAASSECRPLLKSHLSRIRHDPPLTRQQERQLAQDIQAGCDASCEELVRSNLSFVVSVANKYRNLGLPFEDLLNEGNLGLVEAARRFDPSVGTKFITYAIWWIRKRILRALTEQSTLVYVPTSQSKRVREIRNAESSLSLALGTKPTREEISARIKKSLPSIHRTLQLETRESSLDRGIGEDGERPLSDRLADARSVDPEGYLIDRESIERLTEALNALRNREREVVMRRFGFQTGSGLTLQEVGDMMHISRERVRQIENKAKARLRRILVSGKPRRPSTSKKLNRLH
jgi:RNA polymerase primary sigma factor